MRVTLIGYRGCGKSTLAPLLARRLQCEWVDADVVIEQQAGCTIKEIFAREGEPGFRQREAAVLRELLVRDPLVIAAGGGAILSADTRRLMREAGPVIWLQAPLETLAARIAGDATTAERRPNLAGGGTAEIAQMLAFREPLYRETATLTVDAGSRPPEDLIDEILAQLPLRAAGGRSQR
jgi:shikimate kinase